MADGNARGFSYREIGLPTNQHECIVTVEKNTHTKTLRHGRDADSRELACNAVALRAGSSLHALTCSLTHADSW